MRDLRYYPALMIELHKRVSPSRKSKILSLRRSYAIDPNRRGHRGHCVHDCGSSDDRRPCASYGRNRGGQGVQEGGRDAG